MLPASLGKDPSQLIARTRNTHSRRKTLPGGMPGAGKVAVLEGLRLTALCAAAACRSGSAMRQPAASASTKSRASKAAHRCKLLVCAAADISMKSVQKYGSKHHNTTSSFGQIHQRQMQSTSSGLAGLLNIRGTT